MRVALAKTEPLDEVTIFRIAELFRLFDQPGSRQTLGLHEVAIGMRDRALGQSAQGRVVIEDGRQIRFVSAQLLAVLAQRKCSHPGQEALAGQRFENLEDVAGFFLVLQQVAEVAISLWQRVFGLRSARVAEQCAVTGGFHVGGDSRMLVHARASTDKSVNIRFRFQNKTEISQATSHSPECRAI